jgi:tol-pal system protein YbgF
VIQQPQEVDDSQGVEAIGETPIQPPQVAQGVNPQPASSQVAGLPPTVRPLGTTRSAASNDGGFQGKVLVAPGGMVVASANDNDTDGSAAMSADANASTPAAEEQQAAVQNDDPVAETPDDLFLRSEKALLQLQYSNAEDGFKEFIAKYPDHNLAGSAEFKLGETYWAEQNFSSAAQAYIDSYKKYPKGRRAPDSLLKLGLSLARLGQKDQACATIGSVDTEYPNAVDVKKRAQAEFKRAGC